MPCNRIALLFVVGVTAWAGPDATQRARVLDAYGKLPLQFEKNEGQADGPVKYLARGQGYTVFLTEREAVLAVRRQAGNQSVGADLRLRVRGAAKHPILTAFEPLDGQVSYFRGNDTSRWRAGIHTWEKVQYEQVYPGVDLVFYGRQGQLEFDFAASAGADLSAIRLSIEGAQARIDAGGNIALEVGGETVIMRKPLVYQGCGSARQVIPARFVLRKSSEIAFAVGKHDTSQPTVIDPVLIYASYLGGTQQNAVQGIAVNAAGEAFVTGYTLATNFPTTAGSLQPTQPACTTNDCGTATGGDAFVARISADGTHLIYSTYLGGNNQDQANAITIDGNGNTYVTGFTFSNDFPLKNPYQSLCNPSGAGVNNVLSPTCEVHTPGEPLIYSTNTPDVFITKLNPTGTQILYSTFFGGSANDNATGIAVDAQGQIYIAGNTSSLLRSTTSSFPVGPAVPFPVTASAYQDSHHAAGDQDYFNAFVAKFSADGQTLLYSTVFGGGPGNGVVQTAVSMGLGPNGFVAIGGDVTSPTMPVKNAIQSSCPAIASSSPSACYGSGYLAGFDTTQSGSASLLFSTYLSGSVPAQSSTVLNGVAVDAQNNVYATGHTQAHDFPTTPGTLSPGCTNIASSTFCGDAYVIKLNSTGGLVWETNYGTGVGCDNLAGTAVTTDSRGNVYVAGTTNGCSGPLKNPFQSSENNGSDAFIITLSPDASQLLFGSLYGGNNSDTPTGVAVDPNGNIYVGGFTNSTNLPDTTGFFQPNYAGGTNNGFVIKASPITVASSTSVTASPNPAAVGQNVVLTAAVTGASGQPTPTGSVSFLNGSSALGSMQLNASGVAALTVSSLAVGSYQFTANYSGDGNYSPSSGTVQVMVSQQPTFTLTLTASPGNGGVITPNPPSSNGMYISGTKVCLTVTPNSGFMFASFSGATLDSSNCLTVTANASVTANFVPQSGSPALQFVPVTPCRIADTRNTPNGPFAGPSLVGNSSRDFLIPNSACNIPFVAAAYSLNVTVVPHQPLSYLTIWPTGSTQPVVSTLNSFDGRIKANAAIVPAGSNGGVSVFVTNPTDVILDIDGYFVPASSGGVSLAFYPVTPCRIADTRSANGALGGPSLGGNSTRTFPVLSSPCNIPPGAQAYSLNYTAVPKNGSLLYLSTWPTGQTQPLVSTLNAPTGTITANAAIVPAGTNGQINVFVTDQMDLVLDIDGYFAPPGSGGLALYNLTPCRVLDTRNPAGSPPFSGEKDVNVTSSGCGAPPQAQAYVFNATVVPAGPLTFLTLWAKGQSQPLASSLNALDGQITSNMALVPAGSGSISAFASSATHLILDIAGYFAPLQ